MGVIMANHALLNNIDHQDLKVVTERSSEYGDNLWYAQTFAQEFRSIQAHYPILFQQDQNNGTFVSVALFGFTQNENLFLNDNGWQASYIPLSVQRQPFLIGQQERTTDGVTEQHRVITLDLDSPRVSKSQGQPLFLPYGGNSDYLETIANVLETLHQGLQDDAIFSQTLTDLDLLESVTLDIELNNTKKHQLIGFYTINEDKLNALSAEKIKQLQQSGYLHAIYMALASQVQIAELVARKNAQIAS